nr:ABC transporter permease [Candidatus Endomicrobium trichonymphae]
MELCPVLTAIVITGRIGAAITAELGTMKITEQLDALYMLGISPVRFLAVPRLLACFLWRLRRLPI